MSAPGGRQRRAKGVPAAVLTAVLSSLTAAGPPGLARAAGPAALEGSVPQRFTVRITEPVEGDYVFGKARIAVEIKAREPVKGLRVEFSLGGRLIFIDREPPFECYHEFGDQPRSWVIEAKAVSPEGLAVTDTIVTRRLDIHYREEVDRVVLAASVLDDENSFIEGLTKDDFAVFEDGVQQQILEFGVETRPITLGVLIDTSGSMKEEIGQVQDAAKDFVGNLRPEDRAFVVDLDENVFLLEDLTSDHGLLQAAIEGTDAEGGTALYDAIYGSYWKMKPIQGRKAIAALTDGEDTSSRFSYQKVLELTRTHDAIVYAIGLGASVMDVQIRGSLKQLSDDSGGRAFFPKTAEGLAEVYHQIAADLRSQYFITYSPSNRALDGSWRTIRVDCRRPEAKIRTRRGYYAVKH